MRVNGFFLLFLTGTLCYHAQVMNVRKWRTTERDSLDNALNMVEESFYEKALPTFEQLLKNHPSEPFLKFSYAKCALQRGDRQHEAFDLLGEIYKKNKKIPDIQFDMTLAAFYLDKFDEAAAQLELYRNARRTDAAGRLNADRLLRYINFAKQFYADPGQSKITLLGENVNSEAEEFAPAIDAIGRRLVYAYAGPESTGGLQPEDVSDAFHSNVYLEDIFEAEKQESDFLPAHPLDSLNTRYAEKVASLSADGKALFIYQDAGDGHGDIYLSSYDGARYITPVLLKGEVNSYSREGHAALSPDGQTLYFSSARMGGYGGMDLYRATLSADSVWTNVQNLGASVNSLYDEDTPFMAADGISLFFSSRGHSSMGGFDIFMSRMQMEDSTFSVPQNLGLPVNYTSDDMQFVISADGKTAFFSAARRNGFGKRDIYQVQPVLPEPLSPTYILKGKARSEGKAIAANIGIEIIGKNARHYNTLHCDSAGGEYLAVLLPGNVYQLTCSYLGLSTKTGTIDATDIQTYTEKTVDFNLLPSPLAGTKDPSVNALDSAAPAPPSVVVSHTTVAWPDKDGFMPLTLLQKKAMRFRQRYGKTRAPGLVFRVQFAALAGQGNLYFPSLSRHGKIERLRLGDGYTRLTLGGNMKTLQQAFAMNKKAIRAGQEEAFVIAIYKGKKVEFEELEQLGIFK